MLNTLRWAGEIRPCDELQLPAVGKQAHGLKDSELKMAAQLVKDMAAPWRPEQYTDRFRTAVMALVEAKTAAGDTHTVTPLEAAEPAEARGSNVVDLTELLKRSLNRAKGQAVGKPAAKAKIEPVSAGSPKGERKAAARPRAAGRKRA